MFVIAETILTLLFFYPSNSQFGTFDYNHLDSGGENNSYNDSNDFYIKTSPHKLIHLDQLLELCSFTYHIASHVSHLNPGQSIFVSTNFSRKRVPLLSNCHLQCELGLTGRSLRQRDKLKYCTIWRTLCRSDATNGGLHSGESVNECSLVRHGTCALDFGA